MADLDPTVALANWAAFVDRSLRRVRPDGLSDRKIYALSGISTSTLSRWRNAKGSSLPDLDRVKVFCRVVGASLDEAMSVLGMADSGPAPTPQAPIPADVQVILHRLQDPKTGETEREFIRMSLAMLADRVNARAKPEAS